MKKVMFFTYGGGHSNIVKYIYNAMEVEINYQIDVIAFTAGYRDLKKNGIPCRGISSVIKDMPDANQVLNYGESLASKNYDKDSGIPFNEISCYLGVGFTELVNQYGSYQKAKSAFDQNGRSIFCPVKFMTYILKKESPDAVILTSGVRMEKAAGIAANELGIPVIRVCDLPIAVSLPYTCTLCVMNEWSYQYVLKHFAILPEDVIITGQPVFENNIKLEKLEIDKIHNQFSFKNWTKIILYLEQPGNPDTLATEQELMRLANKHNDYLYLIKLHPNQNLPETEQSFLNYIVVRDIPVKYLIELSDLAITWSSTSGLEAALMNKPVITIMLHEEEVLDLEELGVAKKITALEKLENIIEICCDCQSELSKILEEGRKKFKNTENAAKKIVTVIKKKIGE